MARHFLWFKWTLVLALVGCSFPGNRPTQTQRPYSVRDTPHTARKGVSLRKRLLVLPFVDEVASRSQKVTDVARRTVVGELLRTGQFVVVRNSDLPQSVGKFMTEKREYDLERVAQLAASMGVAAVIEGKIMEIKARRVGDQVGVFREIKARISTSVRLRVVAARNGRMIMNDVRTGTVEASTTQVAKYSFSDKFLAEDPNLVRKSVSRAFYGTIPQIVKSVEKLSWEGRVALISGERVFVNAGRLSGIQIGDILKVTEEGEEVYDPENGSFIGRAPGRMKGTVEVVSYFGKDGAIGLVHSGSGFRENDRVELY